MPDFKYGDITEKIIGAAFRVHGTLGNGFPEVMYQRALALEFDIMPLEYAREFEMPVYYLDKKIGTRRVDFLVAKKISIELKAALKVEDAHLAQAMNYLEAYNLEIGLLLNFGSRLLEYHRFTNKKYKPETINHPNYPIHSQNPS
ncbi:MAG: GxxExxY protein [Bacteroidota bacterium]|nr:GxxExxY protein [Bacteroidota bacterium]